MTGGCVEFCTVEEKTVRVTVYGTQGYERGEVISLRLEKNPDSCAILPGDTVWWGVEWAYWTPAGQNTRQDIKIRRASATLSECIFNDRTRSSPS